MYFEGVSTSMTIVYMWTGSNTLHCQQKDWDIVMHALYKLQFELQN